MRDEAAKSFRQSEQETSGGSTRGFFRHFPFRETGIADGDLAVADRPISVNHGNVVRV